MISGIIGDYYLPSP